MQESQDNRSQPLADAAGPGSRIPVRRTVLAVVLSLVLPAVLYSSGHFVRKGFVLSYAWLLPVALLTGMLLRVRRARGEPVPRVGSAWPWVALSGGLALLVVSGLTKHRWFYFVNWHVDTLFPFKSTFVAFVFGTAVLTPFFIRRHRRPWLMPGLILIGSQFVCFAALLHATGGQALYRTDHPSFMFRLWEFSRTFPQLVNYNPYWNAGTVGCVELTSGTLAPGLALWPLWRFMPVHSVYTVGVALLFIVLVPWIACLSVRAMGGDRTASCVGGILGLGVSQHFFLWMLHYGTIGASLSSAMALPVSALVFRVTCQGRRQKWVAVALVPACCFLLLWPPGAISGLAVGLACLLHCRRWTWRRFLFLAGCALAVAVLYGGCLAVLFREGNHVVSFVMDSGGEGQATFAWLTRDTLKSGLQRIVAHLQEGNPLLIVFGLAGICIVSPRVLRTWFAPIFLVLLLVTGWAEEWKPHSQLSRMSIPLLFVSIAPAALLLRRAIASHNPRLAMVRAGLIALLGVTGFNVAHTYANRGRTPYVVMSPEMHELVQWVRDDVPPGGRVMFAGCCVHAYGQGNVAYLPALTGHEMMADDYYGFPIGTIEYEYPPRPFRKDYGMMQAFLGSYNITHVLTYHDKWKAYFRDHPDLFEEAFSVPSFHLTIVGYRVKREARQLLKGRGTLDATFNRIAVSLEDGQQEEVVLTYNWVGGLTSPDDVELFPHSPVEGIHLIGVRPKGRKSFTIRY